MFGVTVSADREKENKIIGNNLSFFMIRKLTESTISQR